MIDVLLSASTTETNQSAEAVAKPEIAPAALFRLIARPFCKSKRKTRVLWLFMIHIRVCGKKNHSRSCSVGGQYESL
jgi:hypothetical protein